MDAETKSRAIDKVDALGYKIGYPEFLLDPAKLDEYYSKARNRIVLFFRFHGRNRFNKSSNQRRDDFFYSEFDLSGVVGSEPTHWSKPTPARGWRTFLIDDKKRTDEVILIGCVWIC